MKPKPSSELVPWFRCVSKLYSNVRLKWYAIALTVTDDGEISGISKYREVCKDGNKVPCKQDRWRAATYLL